MAYATPIPAGRRSSANVPDGGNDRVWITWMTCGNDGYEHAVNDEGMTAGYRQRRGLYGAVCGHVVTAQALVAPPGRRCACCQDAVFGQRAPRKEARWKGWLRNILREGKHIKIDLRVSKPGGKHAR